MKDHIQLFKKDKNISGNIRLAGSKSISNRVLVIKALAKSDFEIQGLANSKDTATLLSLLNQKEEIYNTGAAGTTFRFMTALLALKGGQYTLTGSERMKQRPIGQLVDALNLLGANIEYLEKEGYPPLQFKGNNGLDKCHEVCVPASISSQFITALLLIAPSLPNGLKIELTGKIVSRPYLLMTLDLMKEFGVDHHWDKQTIVISPQDYQPKDFIVEADWSAASYYYCMAAMAPICNLRLEGLFRKSVQGDQAIVNIMKQLGVQTTFEDNAVVLSRMDQNKPVPVLEYDFIDCPDLAQTVITACAAIGVKGIFTGLETLYIKETNRVHAMKTELQKVNCRLYPVPNNFEKGTGNVHYTVEGEIDFNNSPILFGTYEDHRMAMALAPLSMLHPISIKDPKVVEKSYPDFWRDLELIGFEISD